MLLCIALEILSYLFNSWMFSTYYPKPISHFLHNTLSCSITHSGHLLNITHICLRCSLHIQRVFNSVFDSSFRNPVQKYCFFFIPPNISQKKIKTKMHLHHLHRAHITSRTRHARACSTCNIHASHNAPTYLTAHDNACVTQRDFHIHAHMHTYARAKAFSTKKFLPIRTFHLSTATKTCTLNSSITIKKTDLCSRTDPSKII